MSATQLQSGTVIDNRYRIRRHLGKGGFAEVYEVEHIQLERPAALKVLNTHARGDDDLFIKRFQREARIAANFEHANVVRIFDFGLVHSTGQPYIAMELLEGHDLEQELRRNGALEPSRAIALFVECLDALGLAHANGIIHKDLKPSNLFLARPGTSEERLVILDFGIARIEADPAKLTQTGAFAGTPAYLAPEYIKDQEVTTAFDVYQMGLILIEALTGRQVVRANSSVAYLMKHIQGEHDVPDILKQSAIGPVLERAIAVDPAIRYPNAGAFHTALISAPPLGDLGFTGTFTGAVPVEGDANAASGWDETLDSEDAFPRTADNVRPATPAAQGYAAITPDDAPKQAVRPATFDEKPSHHRVEPSQPVLKAPAPPPRKKKKSAIPVILVTMMLGGLLLFGLIVLGIIVAALDDTEPPDVETPVVRAESDSVVPTDIATNIDLPGTPGDVQGEMAVLTKLHSYSTVEVHSSALLLSIQPYRDSVDKHGFDHPERIIPPSFSNLESIVDGIQVTLDTAPNTRPSLEKLDKRGEAYGEALERALDTVEAIDTYYQAQEWREDRPEARRLHGKLKRHMGAVFKTRLAMQTALWDEWYEFVASSSDTTYGKLSLPVTSALIEVLRATDKPKDNNARIKKAVDELERAIAEFEENVRKNPKLLDVPGMAQSHTGFVQGLRAINRSGKTIDDPSTLHHLRATAISSLGSAKSVSILAATSR